MTCAAEDTPAAKRHDTVWLLFLIYLAYVIAFSLTPYAPTPELLGTRENATFEGLAGIGSSTNWDVITNVLLYVDGTDVGSYATTTNASGSRVSDLGANIYLGNEPNGDRTLDGALDDVRVYNRVLSLAEIRAIQRAGL